MDSDNNNNNINNVDQWWNTEEEAKKLVADEERHKQQFSLIREERKEPVDLTEIRPEAMEKRMKYFKDKEWIYIDTALEAKKQKREELFLKNFEKSKERRLRELNMIISDQIKQDEIKKYADLPDQDLKILINVIIIYKIIISQPSLRQTLILASELSILTNLSQAVNRKLLSALKDLMYSNTNERDQKMIEVSTEKINLLHEFIKNSFWQESFILNVCKPNITNLEVEELASEKIDEIKETSSKILDMIQATLLKKDELSKKFKAIIMAFNSKKEEDYLNQQLDNIEKETQTKAHTIESIFKNDVPVDALIKTNDLTKQLEILNSIDEKIKLKVDSRRIKISRKRKKKDELTTFSKKDYETAIKEEVDNNKKILERLDTNTTKLIQTLRDESISINLPQEPVRPVITMDQSESEIREAEKKYQEEKKKWDDMYKEAKEENQKKIKQATINNIKDREYLAENLQKYKQFVAYDMMANVIAVDDVNLNENKLRRLSNEVSIGQIKTRYLVPVPSNNGDPNQYVNSEAVLINSLLNNNIYEYKIIPVDDISIGEELEMYIKCQLGAIFMHLFTIKNKPWTITIAINGLIKQNKVRREKEAKEIPKEIFEQAFKESSNAYIVEDNSMILFTVNDIWSDILDWIQDSVEYKSGLVFIGLTKMYVKGICQNELLIGGYIEAPENIDRFIINPQNTDETCIIECLRIHKIRSNPNIPLFKKVKNKTRILNDLKAMKLLLDYELMVRYDGINFPINIREIQRLERMNKIHINVLGHENIQSKLRSKGRRGRQSQQTVDYAIYPIYSSIKEGSEGYPDYVNLLVIEKNSDKRHFVLIPKLSKLIKPLIGNHTKMCERCLKYLSTKESYETHITICGKHNFTNITYPTEGYCEFKSYDKILPHPFVIYSDFECIIQKNEETKESIHKPCGWYRKTVFRSTQDRNKILELKKLEGEDTYDSGKDCLDTFMNDIKTECGRITSLMWRLNRESIMTSYDKERQKNAKVCYICQKELAQIGVRCTNVGDIRVVDHCHFTGSYRGPAHLSCNSKLKVKKMIPVIFHNLSGYDMHLFVCNLFDGKIDIIAKTSEKYTSLTIKPRFYTQIKSYEFRLEQYPMIIDASEFAAIPEQDKAFFAEFASLRFIDSYAFLTSSLNSLVSTLPKNHNWLFGLSNDLRVKGIYPYEFMDSYEKMDTVEFPSKEQFYSSLTDSHISNDEYSYALNIWNKYKCQSMRDYHNIYLKSDVILLAEVFENFRSNCLSEYQLDPAHYITTPSLAWDAALKFTKVQLELLTNSDMYEFFENSIRGGVSCRGEYKHIEVDPEFNDIRYLDVNNLYGFCMKNYLPIGEFTWVVGDLDTYLELFPIEKLVEDKDYGYVFEVDLLYPDSLHDDHNAFPLAPEKMNGKLMLTLFSKSKYTVHIQTLKVYIDLGLVITHVYRILKFRHKRWLSDYIDHNTVLRNDAKECNDVSKANFYKLMNNAVYGKTMENVKKRNLMKIVRNSDDIRLALRDFSYKRHVTMRDDFVVMSFHNKEVCLNKPIYVGFCILDYAKAHMYRTYYCWIKRFFGNEATLLYTDTDSLVVNFVKGDLYRKNYQSRLVPFMCDHTLGMLKDEFEEDPIMGFISLKSKCYAIQTKNDNNELKEKLINKGIPKMVNYRELSYSKYIEILDTSETLYANYNKIGSKNHVIYTQYLTKKLLDVEDSKRLNDPKRPNFTFAWGHYDSIDALNFQLKQNRLIDNV